MKIVSLGIIFISLVSCGGCPQLGFTKQGNLSCNVANDNRAIDEAAENERRAACPDPTDTSINGYQNDFSVTLDRNGNWSSQIHFKTAVGHGGLYRLEWRAGINRQTCSGSQVVVNGFNSYLRMTSSPTLANMRVIPGLNYFDYVAYGCRTASETTCTEVVEEGTAVVNVNYVP
ncbi:MAG: hypothetical protein AB7F59_08065 [Bdellovibrionales bacterium]